MSDVSEDCEFVLAPLAGALLPLSAVPDPVFSQGMFGDGAAIDPSVDATSGAAQTCRLVAPCDGRIVHLAKTQHALTLQTAESAEILMHIGIDTVQLNGKGFHAKVMDGTQVKVGDVLIEFDRQTIVDAGLSPITVIAVANSDAFRLDDRSESTYVEATISILFSLTKREAVVEGAQAAKTTVAAASTAAELRKTVTLTQAGGLHARPAARLRSAVQGMNAEISVHFQGKSANALSVVALLSLTAGQGASIELRASGAEAAAALAAAAAELERHVAEDQAEQQAAVQASVMSAQSQGYLKANQLAGVGVAPGTAQGQLRRWEFAVTPPPERAKQAPDAELQRLRTAILAMDQDLAERVKQPSVQGSTAAILTMHRSLLQDPELWQAAEALIAQGQDAGYAWQAAVSAQKRQIEQLEDAHLAARGADLADITKQVLIALGYGQTAGLQLSQPTVLAAEEFTPSDLDQLDTQHVVALVMQGGGGTSHAVIMARQLGLPTLIALGDALRLVPEGTPVIVEAASGVLTLNPSAAELAAAAGQSAAQAAQRAAQRQQAFTAASTKDGHAVEVAANIANIEDAKTAVANGADAIGLLRTELLFMHRPAAPTQDEQCQSYEEIVTALEGRKVIIRTLDIGADKDVDYLTLPPEPNPALGLRGVRLAQVRPDLLEAQLRALLSVVPKDGMQALRILLPMVSDASELQQLRAQIQTLAQQLGQAVIPEIGAMIEVPSAAVLADQLAQYADFFSIGTNDLTQYTLAMDRCRPDLAKQADGLHPAVLRLIQLTVLGAQKHGKWVGVCGALASEAVAVPILLGLGVSELSVDPVTVPSIKALIRELDLAQCQQVAQAALALESAEAVRQLSLQTWPTR